MRRRDEGQHSVGRKNTYTMPLTTTMNKRDTTATAYYVDLIIGGVEFVALIDTGAAITVAQPTLLDRCPELKTKLQYSSLPGVVGIGGQVTSVLGEVQVPIHIGGLISQPHPITIIEEDSGGMFPLVLGMDFLDAYTFSIDTNVRMLRRPDPPRCDYMIPLQTSRLPDNNSIKVTSVNCTVIPARTVMLMEVNIPVVDGLEGCIEPLVFHHTPWMMARSLNRVKHGRTIVEITNITPQSITVPKDKDLARFEPLCDVVTTIGKGPSLINDEDLAKIELFDFTESDLTTTERDLVYGFLARHVSIIGKDETDLGCTHTIEHHIDVQGAMPIKQRYRRFPPPMREEISKAIDKLVKQGIIEPSLSSWSSPLVPVRKKNGKLRICVDFRAINEKTKKDAFPLPVIADAVSHFSGSKYFSSLDLLAGYHQIPLSNESKEITAFSTGDELYQYTRMPFGISNGPSCFSRLVSIVLAGFSIDKAQAYLDDILVAGKDFADHLANLEQVFCRLKRHGLKLNATKCDLFRRRVNYLGHVISKDGIEPLASNVQAIKDFPTPTTTRQVKRFNGMLNFYKKFIPGSADLMQPLYEATTHRVLKWNAACEHAFNMAKKALCTAPVLAYPDFSPEAVFYLTTDASATGAGAVLSQIQHGEERVIGFGGVSLNEAQRRYTATDKELAAIRYGVQHFKPYLYGRRYIIRTDHEPLIYLNRMKRVDDRLHRTLEDLAVGLYSLEYVPGKQNIVADTLSRAEYPWSIPEDDEYPVRYELGQELDANHFDCVLVPGGPDSLFLALSRALNEETLTAVQLRLTVVEALLAQSAKYGIEKGAKQRKHFEIMKSASVFPAFVLLQVFADEYGCVVIIHHSEGPLIIINPKGPAGRRVFLQCLGGVHFNVYIPKVEAICSMAPRGHVVSNERETKEPTGTDDSKSKILEEMLGPLRLPCRPEVVLKHQWQDSVLRKLRHELGKMDQLNTTDWVYELGMFGPHVSQMHTEHNGVLYFSGRLGGRYVHVPVLPRTQLEHLSVQLHSLLGHAGRDKVLSVFQSLGFHPAMSTVVAQVVRTCEVCQKFKGHTGIGYPLYKRVADRPFEVYALDLMDLRKTTRGYNCVLVGVDRFSRFGHAIPLRNKTSRLVAEALESHILMGLPRTPETILTDGGPEFKGHNFQSLLRKYGIRHERSVAFRPHTNGAVERLNKTLKDKLATTCEEKQEQWDKWIYFTIAQYNRTPHAETGRAPVEYFNIGQYETPIVPETTKTDGVWQKGKEGFRRYNNGDLVMRRIPFQAVGQTSKLAPKFDGPYEVECLQNSEVVYRLRRLIDGKVVEKVHVSQIKPYFGKYTKESTEKWLTEQQLRESAEKPHLKWPRKIHRHRNEAYTQEELPQQLKGIPVEIDTRWIEPEDDEPELVLPEGDHWWRRNRTKQVHWPVRKSRRQQGLPPQDKISVERSRSTPGGGSAEVPQGVITPPSFPQSPTNRDSPGGSISWDSLGGGDVTSQGEEASIVTPLPRADGPGESQGSQSVGETIDDFERYLERRQRGQQPPVNDSTSSESPNSRVHKSMTYIKDIYDQTRPPQEPEPPPIPKSVFPRDGFGENPGVESPLPTNIGDPRASSTPMEEAAGGPRRSGRTRRPPQFYGLAARGWNGRRV